MGQSLIFMSQHGQKSLTVAPLVVNMDFFNSPAVHSMVSVEACNCDFEEKDT